MEVMSELSEAHGNTQRYLQYIRGRGIHNYCQYVAFGISRLTSLDHRGGYGSLLLTGLREVEVQRPTALR